MSRGQVERIRDTRDGKVMEVSETSGFVLSFAQNRFLTGDSRAHTRAPPRGTEKKKKKKKKIRTKIGKIGFSGTEKASRSHRTFTVPSVWFREHCDRNRGAKYVAPCVEA